MIYSENEEEHRAQKILFGSNVKYDFDNSRNEEEDEKELLKNKFENLGKTPDANDKIDSINNIAEIKSTIHNCCTSEDEGNTSTVTDAISSKTVYLTNLPL